MSMDVARADGSQPAPYVSKLCDVVLNDLTQSQIPRLEVLLHQMGAQIYSANEDEKRNHTHNDFVPISAEPSPVMSDQLAKDKDTQIIPALEAECMFGNVGEVLAANKVLLCELEVEYDQGAAQLASVVGNILARNIYTFGCYDTYLSNFERAQKTYNSMLKHRPFREFIERTQHSMTDIGNAGLRELMIEPMQRIPRYQLLIGNLIKHLPVSSPQVQRLQDASAAATVIASRRVTDGERLAAVLWSCQRTIDRFPPELVSSHRELLGCIDVDEITQDTVHSRAIQTLGSVLGRRARPSYALLVFTDALVLIQRHSTVPTHFLLGVHEPEKLVDRMRSSHIGGLNSSAGRRTELSFAGMTSLLNLRASGHGSQFTIELERPMHGAPNKAVLVRQFVDAIPDAQNSHIPLFLECLWQAQAVYRARGHALAARQNVTLSSKGPLTLIWTLFTRTQYEQFEHHDRMLVIIGALDTPSRQAMSHASELFVNIELQDHADECMAYMSRAWGSQTQQITVSLVDLPCICADLYVLSTLPHVQQKPVHIEVPQAEPVRRAQSLRTDQRRNVPSVHRARSLISERVRASIQESLEAVQEENEREEKAQAEYMQLGRKRSVPMGDRTNEPSHVDTPKRRAVPSEAPGEENTFVPVEPMDERGTPQKRAPAQMSMYADDTLDLPNPFQEHETLPSASPVLPEPTKMEAPLVDPLPDMSEEPMPEVFQAPSTELAPEAAASAQTAEAELPTVQVENAPLPPPKESKREFFSIPPSKTVTEAEMHEMLKPLLEHIQVAPMHQPVVVQAKPAQAAESKRAEIVVPQPLDASFHKLQTLPEEASEEENNANYSEPCDLVTMRRAIQALNERIAAMRNFSPSSTQSGMWADERRALKHTIKHLNTSWTRMERAYENNQMELASLRLAQPEHDTRVHLTPEEYAELQNQGDMVLPLQLQVEKLQKQCASLQELEKDARLENTELYNVFNEELSKLYQHSFRPANEEIDMLRAELVASKTQVNELRKENRQLRLHNTLGGDTA